MKDDSTPLLQQNDSKEFCDIAVALPMKRGNHFELKKCNLERGKDLNPFPIFLKISVIF
jgi:hypothetical protein